MVQKSSYRFIDGSAPISSLLYHNEELVASQEGVGLYDGKEKTPERQNGSIHLTTHRILYIDLAHPRKNSFALGLSSIRQSEYYAGFLTSSSKVTVYLSGDSLSSTPDDPGVSSESTLVTHEAEEDWQPSGSWVCSVCSYSNPYTADAGRPKCILCGVPRDPRAYTTPIPNPPPPPSPPASVRRSPSMPMLRHPELMNEVPTSDLDTYPGAVAIPDTGSLSSSRPCHVCTYLNHPTMHYCEICGTFIGSINASSTPALTRSSGSTPLPASVMSDAIQAPLPSSTTLRISFRKGGDKLIYNSLKKILKGKAWENTDPATGSTQQALSTKGPALRLGIQGIFDTLDLNARSVESNLQGSLLDLEILMAKAKDMVELASSLNAKLSAQEEEVARRRLIYPDAPTNRPTMPEEATFIRSSLAQLGLPTVAVTQDMVKDENKYHEELARELSGILTGHGSDRKGLMGSGEAIIGLDEVWGGWNRARGVALIPPSSLLMAATYLPQLTNPRVNLRVFRSGLRVLHTPKYGEAAFASQLVRILSGQPQVSDSRPQTTVQIATYEQLSVGLAEEMIESVEEAGRVVRDEGAANEQTRWFVNILQEYQWDGMND